jgi:hypothetical protein
VLRYSHHQPCYSHSSRPSLVPVVALLVLGSQSLSNMNQWLERGLINHRELLLMNTKGDGYRTPVTGRVQQVSVRSR